MKSLLVITLALLFSTQVVAGNLRLGETLSKVSQALVVPALGIALAIAPVQQATAQGQPEEALTVVTAEDPTYRHGAMLLRVSVPPAEGEETGEEYAFHLAFIGLNEQGSSLLVGRERQSGRNVGEKLDEASNVSLLAWDGVVGDGLTVSAIDSFEDVTGDDIYNVVLLAVEGVNLSAKYAPLQLDDGFPYAVERDMEVLTYRLRYSPLLNEEELAQDGFPLSWLKCNSVPHPNLAIIGTGFTTCGITGKTLPNSAPLIHDEKLVALQSLDSPTLLDEDGNALVWYASGIPSRAVEFSKTLNNVMTPVNPAGKVATTWGAIKLSAFRNSH